jgi:hypothetical protein
MHKNTPSDEGFKEFFDSTIGGAPNENIKVIISQYEENRLSAFIVCEVDVGKRNCGGFYHLCDVSDESNSASLCHYFEIVKYLKEKYGIDVTFEWDWFLKWGNY